MKTPRFANERVRVLLSDENLKNFNALLMNLTQTSAQLEENLNESLKNINRAAIKISAMGDSVNISAKDFSKLSKQSVASLDELGALKVPLIENLELLKLLLIRLNALSSELKKSPADLLFKRSKTKKAPNEK